MKEYLDEPLHQFDNGKDFFDFLYKYNLARFLGVAERSPFRCLFHEDNKPSASVFQTDEDKGGVWLYKCFSEELVLNIKELVKRLAGFRNDTDTLEFLKKCLNVEMADNVWVAQKKEKIRQIIDQFDNDFETMCPVANKNIKWGKGIFNAILRFAYDTVEYVKEIKTSDIIFYMSNTDITRYSEKRDRDKVSQWIKVFAYHGMLKMLPDSEIPKDVLNNVTELTKKQNKKRVSFYQIEPLFYDVIEQRAKRWKENHYTLKGVSYEMFLRTEGKDVANTLYPQYVDVDCDIATVSKTTNQIANMKHDKLHDICIELISKQGYFTEKQLIESYGSKVNCELQLKRSIQDICNVYGFKKVRLNKELKETYSVKCNGYPFIYIEEIST